MIIIELTYSFHLGSDKNKKNSSKVSAKSNVRGTTSKSNNAIQKVLLKIYKALMNLVKITIMREIKMILIWKFSLIYIKKN